MIPKRHTHIQKTIPAPDFNKEIHAHIKVYFYFTFIEQRIIILSPHFFIFSQQATLNICSHRQVFSLGALNMTKKAKL